MVHQFIENSNEGYAIYSAEDRIVYCNGVFADCYHLSGADMIGMHFDELMRYCHRQKVGSKIDNPDVEAFLAYTRTVRRKRRYRVFEVDFYDGRWFLISEQINERGELLTQMKELTKQKLLLKHLEDSIESLNEIALTDELTQVANRRGFLQIVDIEMGRSQRKKTPIALVLLDLDLFKPINDQYGHVIGDQVLIHFTDLIKAQLRPYDVFGRIGGDEFAVFLGDTDFGQASEVCERLRNTVASTPFTHEGLPIPLSVSIGVTMHETLVRFDQLYQEADSALYCAKDKGRNCIEVYPHSATTAQEL